VKQECPSKLIRFGEGSLRRALRELEAHNHGERNPQGKGNVVLFPYCRGADDEARTIDPLSRAPRPPRRSSQVLLPKGRMSFLTIRVDGIGCVALDGLGGAGVADHPYDLRGHAGDAFLCGGVDHAALDGWRHGSFGLVVASPSKLAARSSVAAGCGVWGDDGVRADAVDGWQRGDR
jgi:hypothetical protein